MAMTNGFQKIIYHTDIEQRAIYLGFSLILPFGSFFIDIIIKMIYHVNRSEHKLSFMAKIILIIYYFFICIKAGEIIGKEKNNKIIYVDFYFYLASLNFIFYPILTLFLSYKLKKGYFLE